MPSIDFNTEGMPEIPPFNNANAEIRQPQTSFNPNYNPFNSNAYRQQQNYDWEKLYSDFETPDAAPPANDSAGNMIEKIARQSKISEFHEIQTADFQLKNKYIVTSSEAGMLLIDQHRAHVRILYENFLAEIENRKAPSQQILFPEIFTVDIANLCYFEQIYNELRYAGFEFHKTGDSEYEVTGIPALPANESVLPVLHEVVRRAKNAETGAAAAVNEMVAAALAESVAIRTGKTLVAEEMNDIIAKLLLCRQPNFTPDGKSTAALISMEEIGSRFRN
jgi:DNA mismatch repair protein MutL